MRGRITLTRKLVLWFLGVALGVTVVTLVWVARAAAMRHQVDEFINLTTPRLVALGQIKAAALELAGQGGRSARAEAVFQQWLNVYAGVAQEDDQAFLTAIRQAERVISDASVSPEATAAAEQVLIRILDKATAVEVSALKQAKERVRRSAAEAVRLSQAAAALVGLLAAAAGAWIAGTIVRPVIRLAADAAIVGRGDLSHRTPVRSRDELGDLAEAFNRMTENLERITVSRETLRLAYEELQRTQQQLVQSEKLAALGRFSAGVAHEVKNPLAIVMGGVEMLEQKHRDGDEETRTSLGLIKDAVLRADTIVRDLLKFSRPSPLRTEPVNPAELVDGTLALLRYGNALGGVTVETRFAHDGCRVAVDKNQIQQVLLNLAMNAVEAMDHGGALTVTTAAVAGSGGGTVCTIAVADTGEGIPPEHLAQLFEPFFTTKRDKKGTGLGLSVSKTIVESHGGTIQVASRVGVGTTVSVALPVAGKGAGA